ncbi:MAG TPA: DUF2334 domain-containing protein [Lentimicrobium sp.]|nr:DUF2334 domain-containing protein [Lentimicrobium sp.]
MVQNKYIFLRNDDVRDKLDKELVRLTEICLDLNIPISHAVEPANISKEVSEWLLMIKRNYPHQIEIIQHGYNHNLQNPDLKMEFGGNRSFEDQFQTMSSGKKLMDKYFKDKWSPVFTFPYGTFNQSTLEVIEKLGYTAISSKIDFTPKNMIKNRIGSILKKDFILNKKISYHPGRRSKYKFREISVSANFIKKYLDENNAEHFTPHEVISQIKRSSRHTNIIGLLFHHRFHTNELNKIEETLKTLKEIYRFSTIMNLVR